MTKTESRLLTLLFCLFLGGLTVLHAVLPDRERSEAENRTLAQIPAFTWEKMKDGSFTRGVEDYIADQFPMRDSWTGLKARCEWLLGKQEFKSVYLCGDTLISKVAEPDEKLVSKNLGYVKKLAEKTDVPVAMGLIPSAAKVWADRLPAGAASFDQTAFLQRAAQETRLPQVDLDGALQLHAAEPIYYRTDHHWTSLGAFYGANAVLEYMGQPPLERGDFTPETASDTFNGTLYSTSGVHWLHPDIMEFWVKEDGLQVTGWKSGKPKDIPLYDRSYLEVKDKYSAFLGGNQPLCVIRNEAAEGGRLLLVRDSYSDSLAPFLAQRFSEVHLLDLRYYHASVAAYAQEQGIDQILILYSAPNFITDNNLVFLSQ